MTVNRVILQLMQTRGLGETTLRKLLAQTGSDIDELRALVEQDPVDLESKRGLSRKVAAGVEDAREDAARIAEELERHDVKMLVWGTPAYPERLMRVLRDSAPPVLFMRGSLAALERTSVAFAGSRKSSEKGVQTTRDSAARLAEAGINVVSGYAQGIDIAAHHSALFSGGITTAVLAEGILHFKGKVQIANLITDENFLVISEFPPRLPWTARSAMQRNRTICGLSNVLIVVEAGESGGTLAAGKTALELGLPVFAVNYERPPESARGNATLIELGAMPIGKDSEGKPSLERVFSTLESNAAYSQKNADDHVPLIRQQELFNLTS
jgi:DNA protecting protein DprA